MDHASELLNYLGRVIHLERTSSDSFRPSIQDSRSQTDNAKCWWRCGEARTILQCWWECELIPKLWKAVWQYLLKVNILLYPVVQSFPIFEYRKFWWHLKELDCIKSLYALLAFPLTSSAFSALSDNKKACQEMHRIFVCLLWTPSSLTASGTLSYPNISHNHATPHTDSFHWNSGYAYCRSIITKFFAWIKTWQHHLRVCLYITVGLKSTELVSISSKG